MEAVKNRKLENGEVANQVAPCYRTNGPGGIRTPDHGIKSPALYLPKLLAHKWRIFTPHINLFTFKAFRFSS